MAKLRPNKSPTDVAASSADEAGGYVSDHLTAGELLAVLTISRALSGALDVDRVLGLALAAVTDVIGAEGSSVLLVDPDTGGMSFHVAAGPGAEIAKTISLPPDAGICGHVARTGEPTIVNDAQNDARLYRQVDQATGMETRNVLCVPFGNGQRQLGVLELINKLGEGGFGERDLHLAEAVGGQIGLALENARLHTEIVQRERMATVGRTVSGLAHCVKNILNGIRSGSAVLARSLKDDDFESVRKGWQTVSKNNDMLGALVMDMLSLARDTKVHPFPTDVDDLAEQICQLLGARAAEREIDVSFTAGLGGDDVMVDPTQLYRCLLNLVSNAIDACGDGGRVRVRTHRGRGRRRFTISVTDDGPGIPADVRKKLFGEFFTTKGSRGTGLGLPVTRKLITQMGGTITFHSVEGCGAKFVIALPLEAPSTDDKET